MRERLLRLICAGCLALLTGCYQLPKQSGTWIGSVEPRTVYDAQGGVHTSTMFSITSGPTLKRPELMPTSYIVVNRDMSLWLPPEAGFTNVAVRGLIVSDYARVPTPGTIIVGDTPEKSWISPYVIRIETVEPVGASNGHHLARRMTMQTRPVAGSRR
jgi:hypothetical protein